MTVQEYKAYQIKPHKLYPNNYVVVTAGQGGKIPAVLETMFTSRQYAMEAIDLYLNTKKKGKSDDEEIIKG